jgi:hypothetical protein
MDEDYELPEYISEIHLGFLSGKFYIGNLDLRQCVKLSINFDGDCWHIKTNWKNGQVSEKSFDTGPHALGIWEQGAWEKSPWNKKTAE